MTFIYHQSIPETCRDWPSSIFEESRLIDPALCRDQIADLRRIVNRICATKSCKIDPASVEIFISDHDQRNAFVYIDKPPEQHNGRPQPKYKPTQKKILIFVHRGAFAECETEDQLAVLLSHELGHPSNRKLLGLEEKPNEIPGRIDETMADGWRAIFLVEAEYDWRALEQYIQKYGNAPLGHVFKRHGRKQERLKTVYDVLGARGIKTQTEIMDVASTPLSNVYKQPDFLAAKHESYLDAYKHAYRWDRLSPLGRLNLLSEIVPGILTLVSWRGTEYVRDVTQTAQNLEAVPSQKALHGVANNLVKLFPDFGYYAAGYTAKELRFIEAYWRLVRLQIGPPWRQFPALGPYAKVASSLQRFMDAETERDILKAAQRLMNTANRLMQAEGGNLLLKYGHIKFPGFTVPSLDPTTYPWRKYDGLLKKTQSEILLRALWMLGASYDKQVWDQLDYDLVLKAYRWTNPSRTKYKKPTVFSNPDIKDFTYKDEFQTYIKRRIANERPKFFGNKELKDFSLAEIEADPIEFIKALTDDIRLTNENIAAYPDEWPLIRKKKLHRERTRLFFKKMMQHIAAFPEARDFWRQVMTWDSFKMDKIWPRDQVRRLNQVFQHYSYSGSGLLNSISLDEAGKTAPFSKQAVLSIKEFHRRYEGKEKDKPQRWLPLSFPLALSPWRQKLYQQDRADFRDVEYAFDEASPLVEFIIEDPAGFLSGGDKFRLLAKDLEVLPFHVPEKLSWTRKALGYARPDTVYDLSDMTLLLGSDSQPTIWSSSIWQESYFIREMGIFFETFDPLVFSREMQVFLRVWHSGRDLSEDGAAQLNYKIGKLIIEKLRDGDLDFENCSIPALIYLNNLYEEKNLYPGSKAHGKIAEEIIQRISEAQPFESFYWAIKCLSSPHPLLLACAKKIWVETQTRRLGMDNGSAEFTAAFCTVLRKLDKQEISWSVQLDLVKELAKACIIQVETCRRCEEHFAEKTRKAGRSFISDIGLHALGLINEKMQVNAEWRDDLIDFLAHDFEARRTRRFAAQMYLKLGHDKIQDIVMQGDNEGKRTPKYILLALLEQRLSRSHHAFWGLPADWRAGILSQMLITSDELMNDSAESWRPAVKTVQDLLFPLHSKMPAEQRKWARWYRLGTEFYTEAGHATERGPLLALMLGVAKRSNQKTAIDDVEGVRRFAELLNSFDPAHRKMAQIIGKHPDIPPHYAEPFQTSTYMAQEPPRWESVLQAKASLPSAIADAIAWWGPLLGYASFYMAHGVIHEGQARVVSTEHPNALEAAIKGYKRLDAVIRRMAEAEPQFRNYAPIARDMVAQARELAFKETDIEHGRVQLAMMQAAMDGQHFEVDGRVYTRKVVPWLTSGKAENERNYKMMPWAVGLRLEQIECAEERARVAAAELAMSARNIQDGVFDTDGHTGNRLIDDTTISAFDVGGMVEVKRTPKDLARLFSVVGRMQAASQAGLNPSGVIVDTINEAEQKTGSRPADLVQLNKTVVSLGGWLQEARFRPGLSGLTL